MKTLNKDLQMLYRYYHNNDIPEYELGDHLNKKRLRLEALYSWLIEGQDQLGLFLNYKRFFGMSKRQFTRDSNDSLLLFGDLRKGNKEIDRQIAKAAILRGIKLAEEQGDAKAVIAGGKAYADASGSNVVDPDLPDFEKFEGTPTLLLVEENQLRLLDQMTKQGVINFNKLPAEDIDHEELDASTD